VDYEKEVRIKEIDEEVASSAEISKWLVLKRGVDNEGKDGEGKKTNVKEEGSTHEDAAEQFWPEKRGVTIEGGKKLFQEAGQPRRKGGDSGADWRGKALSTFEKQGSSLDREKRQNPNRKRKGNLVQGVEENLSLRFSEKSTILAGNCHAH